MRQQFKEEISKLKTRLLEIFDDVINQFERINVLIQNYDSKLASKILAADDLIDRKALNLEDTGIQLVATQFPVASDLRLIHSILIINIHLERIGDLLYNAAKGLIRLSEMGEKDVEVMNELKAMGEKTLQIVKMARDAFAGDDLTIVEKLREYDDEVDSYFKNFLKRIGDFSKSDHTLEWYVSVVLLSRYFERAADQAVDIGERVRFIITGELSGMF